MIMGRSETLAEDSQILLEGKKTMAEVIDEPIGAKLSRWFLGAVMWAGLAFFVFIWILRPTQSGANLYNRWIALTTTQYFGKSGGAILMFGGPIFLIIFCGIIYLHCFPRSSRRLIKKKSRASLGTHPVIVSSPFGVVSAAELICIVVFTLIVTWLAVVLIYRGYSQPSKHSHSDTTSWQTRVEMVGLKLGFVGQFCLGLLFLPVARGSVLLRVIDIPFEHAVKYHVWLGHFTMSIFSVHGLIYIVCWTTRNKLIEKVLEWKVDGVSNMAGAIALVAGLLMWVTAFQITRINAFELFYYTHQLYIVFVIFMALHVGDKLFGIAFAGIFLFAFDRFLRFCQSRQEVGLLSARVLPCGTCELVLPKPSNLPYNASSFVFINIPVLGRLQWHPFSVSSSPKDSLDNIKFLIKPLGTWTRQLNEAITRAATAKCPLGLEAAVEGPYGHESSYFLEYETLLLVAGGIGVTPFVAIIRDILKRFQLGEERLPRNVTLIWAVKNHKELAILDSLSPTTIFPEYASRLNLIVKAFVTQEVEGDPEVGEGEHPKSRGLSAKYDSAAAQKPISQLVGSGDILWVGAAIASSLFGYLVVTGLIGKFYLFPADHNSYNLVPWWVRGAIVCFSILAGIWLFGGSVILLWYLVGSTSTKDISAAADPLLGNFQDSTDEIPDEKLVQHSNTVYGSRPDLREIFEGCAKRLTGSNVGVLVCGPEGLQSSVATQCRAFNTVYYNQHKVAFSYHSVSFDL